MKLSRAAWLALATVSSVACGSDLVVEDGGGDGGGAAEDPVGGGDARPPVCGGRVTSTPITIAADVGAGSLHPAGDALVIVDLESGRIRAVDRCSGAVSDLAELGADLVSAAVVGDAVAIAADAPPRLLHVPVTGGAIEDIAPLAERTFLVAHGDTVYAQQDLPLDASDADDGMPDVGFFSLDATTGAAALLHRQRVWAPGTSTRIVGASDAGAYFQQFYDCGCNPGLQLVRADGGQSVDVASSAGARDLAAVGDDLLLAVDLDSGSFGEVVLDVVRVPLAGGEPEVLLPRSHEHAYDVRRIAADERAVCWGAWGRAVRCMAPEPGATVRVVGDEETERAGGEDLAMSGGAIYWLSERADGRVELRAAVP